MASITAALDAIKQDVSRWLSTDAIDALCKEHDHSWRDRELPPAATLGLFLQQILHGNCPCSEVRHLGEQSFTPSAYCQARSRLPLKVCQSLLARVVQAALPTAGGDEHLWHGHRTFHIDGSSFSMPDTPSLQEAFGQPTGQKKGCGFPVAHLMVLFSAATGLLLDALPSPLYTSDISQAPDFHAHLNEGDVLLGDDSFASYAHVALLLQAKLHGLFPNHHCRLVDFAAGRPHTVDGKGAVAGRPRSRWIKSLGRDDQLVEWFKPKAGPAWMDKERYDALPASIIVRETQRKLKLPDGRRLTVTTITTLLDENKYPADELIDLRLRRWDVETNIGHLKTTMKMRTLRCKSEDGVRKELAMFALAYNLVRLVMLQAATRQEAPVSRISFIDALKWMRHAKAGDELPALLVNPARPKRIEPRAVKRRPRGYKLMNQPRDTLRELLKKQVRDV